MAHPEPHTDQPRRPAPWLRKLILTVHLVSTISLIGTALVLVLLGFSSLAGADPKTVYPAAHLVEVWLAAPLALIALVTGLVMGVKTTWGLFKYWWVTLKLAITASLTGVIFFVLIPRLGASAAAALEPVPPVFTTAERLPLAIAPLVAVTLLIFNVTLAVYKPGWRLVPDTPQPGARPLPSKNP